MGSGWLAPPGAAGPSPRRPPRAPAPALPGPRAEAITRSGPRYFRARWGTDVAGVVIDDDVDWEELRELVTESYCRLAPRKLVRLVDRPPVSPGR